MEKADFKKETIELVQSSQYFMESLWVIGTEVSKLNASLSSVLSSFFGFLFGIIDYHLILRRFENQLMISRLIQGLTLNRIELLVPYYIETEKVMLRKAEAFSAKTRKSAFPFVLNLSVVKAESNLTVPLTTGSCMPDSFPKAEESEITAESLEKQLAYLPQKTIVHRIAEVQTQLWSRLAPYKQKLSSTLLEHEKQVIPLTFLAGAAISTSLDSSVFSGLTADRPVVSLEGKEAKSGLPEPASLEGSREPPMMRAFKIGVKPSDLTGGITFDPETLRKMGYAVNLSTAIAEKQEPLLEMMAAISGVLASPVASILRIQGSSKYVGTEPKTRSSILHSPITPKERYTAYVSWIQEGSETLQSARVGLSGLPINASNVERLVAVTLIQPISSLQAPRVYRDQETAVKGSKPAGLETQVKLAPVEAFKIPSILASLIAYNIPAYPQLSSEPTVSYTYERPFEVSQVISKKPKPLGEILEPRKLSKMPAASAFNVIEDLLAQSWQPDLAVFMKEIQMSRSTYARFTAELGAAGPVKTALLGELATGFTAPYTIDTVPSTTETPFPYTSEPYPSTEESFYPQSRRQPAPRQNVINVNVFADTAEEDLRDLERKIGRILSEQIGETGAVEPLRTALLGELATGFTAPFTIEINPPIYSSASQPKFGKGSVKAASQDTINVNVFADTAEEDLRDLERKIGRILSEQISRYYGSSKV
jgi:hypothetical protein